MGNAIGRVGAAGLLMAATSLAMWESAGAATPQVRGAGAFDFSGATCGAPPAGFEDFTSYPPIILTGDLEGCWYTKVDEAKDNGAPSGVYLEAGREVFVGRVRGGAVGTFATNYRFESRWAPDVSTGAELVGRCQHPIAAGSGTGGLTGASGRLDFKDVVADGTYVYRGHVSVG